MELTRILHAQGFGARRECSALVAAGHVAVGGGVVDDPYAEFEPEGLALTVRGEPWVCRVQACVMLNKPAGYECSQKPKYHPSVYALLPAPLRTRGVQAIGRLDEDTTGLLLFTDDGALIHRLTSPKRHVAKVYEVGCKHPVDAVQVERLRAGVTLLDDPAPARAAACEVAGAHALRLTLTEGRYHQVKRMLAAVGNRVESLHRSAFGALALPPDLAPGAWRWVDSADAITAGAGPAAA